MTKNNNFKTDIPFKSLPESVSSKEENREFAFLPHSGATMSLFAINPKQCFVDDVTKSATFQNKEVTLRVTDFSGLSLTVFYLWHALLLEFNHLGKKSEEVVIAVDKYMQLRGLKNKKESLIQIKRDLHLLASFSVSYENNSKKKRGKKCHDNFYSARLIQEWGIKNGNITCMLSTNIFEHLKDAYLMPIHEKILKLDPKISAFYASLYLHYLYNMNHNKTNANTVSVEKLLGYCPTIPSREDAHPHLQQRIVEPFEHMMDTLSEQGILDGWYYTKPNKEKLTDDEIKGANFDRFINFYIHFKLAANIPRKQRKSRKVIKHYAKTEKH